MHTAPLLQAVLTNAGAARRSGHDDGHHDDGHHGGGHNRKMLLVDSAV